MNIYKVLWSYKEHIALYGLLLFHVYPVIISTFDSIIESYIQRTYDKDIFLEKRLQIIVPEDDVIDITSPDFKG